MLATNGPQWFDRQRPDSHWPSVGVSVVVTAALFAAAFAAMWSVPSWRDSATADREPPVVIRLDPPPPIPTPAPQPHQGPLAPATPLTIPKSLPAPAATSAVPPIAAPVAAPMALATPRDTAASRGPIVDIPTTPTPPGHGLADTAMALRGGAPIAPAAATIGSRTANTARFRDSVAQSVMARIPALSMNHPATGRERAELEASQRQAGAMQRRGTTAGNSREVVALSGEGMNGAGAVGGTGGGVRVGNGTVMVSIPFPLFSPGPSPEERKRNEALDRDYQLRLRRLDDRRLLKRDSLRTDSLRADSIARRRVVP